MGKHKSIGERINKAKSLAARREVAMDWAANWYADHLETIHALEKALAAHDMATAGRHCGQLKVLHDKALGALPRVIDALCDEDIA